VIEAYGKGLGEKKWKPIEAKLKEGKLPPTSRSGIS
jgi:hypothetical protein